VRQIGAGLRQLCVFIAFVNERRNGSDFSHDKLREIAADAARAVGSTKAPAVRQANRGGDCQQLSFSWLEPFQSLSSALRAHLHF
jgi:hypothetical protein